MKRLFIISMALLGLTYCADAQTVISSSGKEFANSTGQVSFTIGEPVTLTASNSNNVLTQGYHQTRLEVVAVEEVPDFDVSIYPNPTRDRVVFDMKGYNDEVTLELLDADGRLVHVKQHFPANGNAEVNMQDLAAGVYMLNVRMGDNKSNIYRIIKQ